MLVSKLNKDDIMVFKLTNGEEVVAQVVEDNDDHFILKRPCSVVPSGQGLGLVSSVLSANIDRDAKLYKHAISFIAPVMDEMNKHYIYITTGVQLVSKGSIIT